MVKFFIIAFSFLLCLSITTYSFAEKYKIIEAEKVIVSCGPGKSKIEIGKNSMDPEPPGASQPGRKLEPKPGLGIVFFDAHGKRVLLLELTEDGDLNQSKVGSDFPQR